MENRTYDEQMDLYERQNAEPEPNDNDPIEEVNDDLRKMGIDPHNALGPRWTRLAPPAEGWYWATGGDEDRPNVWVEWFPKRTSVCHKLTVWRWSVPIQEPPPFKQPPHITVEEVE